MKSYDEVLQKVQDINRELREMDMTWEEVEKFWKETFAETDRQLKVEKMKSSLKKLKKA